MKDFRLYKSDMVVCGDCFNVIPTLGKHGLQVDHIITDPPYGINFKDKNAFWDSPENVDWDLFFRLANKLLKQNGNMVLFQGYTNAQKLIDKASPYFKLHNWITWDRIKGRRKRNNMVGTREEILWLVKNDNTKVCYNSIQSNIPRIGGRNHPVKHLSENRVLSNVWSDIMPVCPKSMEKTIHPTQKPLALMERCVKIWSNPDDLIIDPFAGSGSTGIACKTLERRFIGIERDEKYFGVMCGRFERGY